MISPLKLLRAPLVNANPLFHGCSACEHALEPERHLAVTEPDFPIDLVYTWVDGNSSEHLLKRAQYLNKKHKHIPDGVIQARFRDNDELRYSLRSVEKYAPWVNRIFIVTDSQTPAWLEIAKPEIKLIDHKDIIPLKYLPTFNSHVIEAYLHRIPGLAEHYIYMNDDFFLSNQCSPTTFFTPNGIPYIFTDWRQRRMDGYNKRSTPHACSFFNTLEHLQKKNILPEQKLITAHGPYPQTKTNAENTFKIFHEVITSFSSNKFRTMDEVAFYSHAAPILAYALKTAVPYDLPHYYINSKRFDRKRHYEIMLKDKNSGHLPVFFCLNDAGETNKWHSWAKDMAKFLSEFFPDKSKFEK